MKVYKIEIENFRLLKEFSIDLEDELSLVIGKNNTGKTSLLTVLSKFLSGNNKASFTKDDFNLEFFNSLKTSVEEVSNDFDLLEEKAEIFNDKGIKLLIYIRYFEDDNLANISDVMMDLNPENNVVVLGFEYSLTSLSFESLCRDFISFKATEKEKVIQKPNHTERNFVSFLKPRLDKYFLPRRKSYEYVVENNELNYTKFIDLDLEGINSRNIINFKYISAKRDVTNKEVDKTLSGQTSKIYSKTESTDEKSVAVDDFKDRLSETDIHLNDIYSSLFGEVVEKVKKFGGIKPNDSEIEIISTLQHRELLQGNTTVVYKHDGDNKLPESLNGLGYMNLISLIFEIEILVKEFAREKEITPADINLLFIEEPEAHTHPQMQYVFIKNIKEQLRGGIARTDGNKRDLQYLISTHSSHIASDSEFNDIKYLKKVSKNSVIAKNVRDLEKEYGAEGEEKNYRFLKQYLTLSRSELFFADKAIFIEGDTERVLLPAMMKKIDQEYNENPLLSQNISIVEVGAHSKTFEKFIDFIGLEKLLVITDLDCHYIEPILDEEGNNLFYANGNPQFREVRCPASDGNASHTSNSSLRFFHEKEKEGELAYFCGLSKEQKILKKEDTWKIDPNGFLMLVYQTQEDGYNARSFEDAFFHVNRDFIISEGNSFSSITDKYLKLYRAGKINVFDFSEKAVSSKTSFAIEVLLNSTTTEVDGKEILFSNWKTPNYINEGLLWLKED